MFNKTQTKRILEGAQIEPLLACPRALVLAQKRFRGDIVDKALQYFQDAFYDGDATFKPKAFSKAIQEGSKTAIYFAALLYYDDWTQVEKSKVTAKKLGWTELGPGTIKDYSTLFKWVIAQELKGKFL